MLNHIDGFWQQILHIVIWLCWQDATFNPYYCLFLAFSYFVYIHGIWLIGWKCRFSWFPEKVKDQPYVTKCALNSFFSSPPRFDMWSCWKQARSLPVFFSGPTLEGREWTKHTLHTLSEDSTVRACTRQNTPHSTDMIAPVTFRKSEYILRLLKDIYPYCTYAHLCIWD